MQEFSDVALEVKLVPEYVHLCHPRVNYGDSSVVLTFESVDEVLWWDHSNEISSAVLLHGTICSSIFYKIKFGLFLNFDFWHSW